MKNFIKTATLGTKNFFVRLWTKIKRRFEHNPNKIKESKFDFALSIVNVVCLLLGVLIVIFPLLNYFSYAFNNGYYNVDVIFFPSKPTLDAIIYVMGGEMAAEFWRSFLNSVIITATVTILSILVEALAAYPLSKFDCPFRGGIMMYFIITMLFSAGVVPIYILMFNLSLTETIWSVILVSISNVSNLLYFKTFFEGLPEDIEEAAKLDGANDLQMFFRIVVPMSLPVIGSCCFFTIVGMWNSYGGAMLFISIDRDAYPLALYIYTLVTESNMIRGDAWVEANVKNIQSAGMLISIIPILCIYPYVIRYIKSGLTIGSVKS